MDKVALGQIFSQYFGFPCQFSFHQLLYIHSSSYHRRYTISILTVSLNNKLKTPGRKVMIHKTNNPADYFLCFRIQPLSFMKGNFTPRFTLYSRDRLPFTPDSILDTFCCIFYEKPQYRRVTNYACGGGVVHNRQVPWILISNCPFIAAVFSIIVTELFIAYSEVTPHMVTSPNTILEMKPSKVHPWNLNYIDRACGCTFKEASGTRSMWSRPRREPSTLHQDSTLRVTNPDTPTSPYDKTNVSLFYSFLHKFGYKR
jgi:hypothetical protein